jgi:hypothetical protein
MQMKRCSAKRVLVTHLGLVAHQPLCNCVHRVKDQQLGDSCGFESEVRIERHGEITRLMPQSRGHELCQTLCACRMMGQATWRSGEGECGTGRGGWEEKSLVSNLRSGPTTMISIHKFAYMSAPGAYLNSVHPRRIGSGCKLASA